jgi:release factor glutamine methyltransferase
MNLSLRSYYFNFIEQLCTIYEKGEAESIADIVFEDLLLMKRHHIHILDKEFGDAEIAQFNSILSRLLHHEPVQYVLGITDFYGLRFRVNKHVLIPRRETEELVEMVIKDVRASGVKTLSILDIGTGSGCIPVSLKKNLPFAIVSAMDISEEALEVAKENAFLNKTDVTFIHDSILSPVSFSPEKKFDIIISNPPYISVSEKSDMHKNVLEYEPHLALFVENNDVLLFYRAIAGFAQKHLTEQGKVYVEINEAYGPDVKDLFVQHGFTNTVVLQDMQGKDRMVSASIS